MSGQRTHDQVEPTGKPGRYQRSVMGLVTSLVVTVVAVGALLYFMGMFRNDYQTEPEKIDYLETVRAAQGAGLTPPYPTKLRKGWIATGVDLEPGDDRVFMLRMLTDDDKFVAVRQEDASVLSLVHTWVDEDATEGEGYRVPTEVPQPVAPEWKGYADEGGDSAYVAEVGDEAIIVFGSAPQQDLQAVIDSLATAPLS